jgi:hypothetical protein
VSPGDGAELHRRLGRQQLVEAGDAAGLGQRAGRVVPHGHAQPLELADVELDALATDELPHDLVAVEVHDSEAVGPGDLVGVIGGQQAHRARHVLHDHDRTTGDVAAQVTRDGARVCVEASARREAHDDPDRLALEELRLSVRRGRGRQHREQYDRDGHRCRPHGARPPYPKSPVERNGRG